MAKKRKLNKAESVLLAGGIMVVSGLVGYASAWAAEKIYDKAEDAIDKKKREKTTQYTQLEEFNIVVRFVDNDFMISYKRQLESKYSWNLIVTEVIHQIVNIQGDAVKCMIFKCEGTKEQIARYHKCNPKLKHIKENYWLF